MNHTLPIFSSSVFRELPQSTSTESNMQSVSFSEECIESTSVIVESTTVTAELSTIIMIQPSITFNGMIPFQGIYPLVS